LTIEIFLIKAVTDMKFLYMIALLRNILDSKFHQNPISSCGTIKF
jgi:hypothetical protein